MTEAMQINSILQMEDIISLLSGRASSTLNRYLNRRFKAAGLNITTEQWSVLTSLWENDKQTQQYICEKTFKDKASMTRLLDILEKNGFVTRVSDPSDRRINLIHLTAQGAETETVANNIVNEAIRVATHHIPPEDLMNVIGIFKKIIRNVEEEDRQINAVSGTSK